MRAVVVGLVVVTSMGLLAGGCNAIGERPPDVILIVMDTTRADHLGAYGSVRDTTPRLDAFAREAEVYLRAWSTSSWTLPAHASLFTGKYVTAHGAHFRPGLSPDSLGDNPPRLLETQTTLAELLRAEGFRTAAFAGAGWLAPEFGLLQGYEVQDAENYRDISAEELTLRAADWMESVPEEEPIHLLVNYFDAHAPYSPREGFDIFSGSAQSDRPGATGRKAASVDAQRSQTRRALNRYAGEIRYMDHHIGVLLERLQAAGRYDDALIVVLADHGEGFGENGTQAHGAWLYEPVLRIPLLVRRPGGRSGGRSLETPVSIVDVLGIILDEAGLRLPPGVDSRALGKRSLVLAEESPSALFKRAARLDRDLVAGIEWPFKLIVNRPGDLELYRLDHDRLERVNLADGSRETELLGRVEREIATLERPVLSAEPGPAMSQESRERLRALGYIE